MQRSGHHPIVAVHHVQILRVGFFEQRLGLIAQAGLQCRLSTLDHRLVRGFDLVLVLLALDLFLEAGDFVLQPLRRRAVQFVQPQLFLPVLVFQVEVTDADAVLVEVRHTDVCRTGRNAWPRAGAPPPGPDRVSAHD